jgi:methionyl-tRNA formyltransferase
VKLTFFGTPNSAVPTLDALVAAGHEVSRVVTRPDRPVGRSRKPQPPPVKRAAVGHGLTVDQPEKVRGRGFCEALAASEPDLLVVVAYGKILPRRVLDAGRLGAVNVHFSLLPKYRGAAPVQWALARCETKTGVTTMMMSEKMDEGDLLLQDAIEIGDNEHAPALTERLAASGAALLVRTLAGLEAGSIVPAPQDEAAATYAPMLRREDGLADFSLPAPHLAGRIRGFDPWPGVWATAGRRRLRLVEARTASARTHDGRPGRILGIDDERALVACGQGSVLAVSVVQPEGRRAMTVPEAVNGRQIRPGDVFETEAETDTR